VHPGDPADPTLPPQLYEIQHRDGNWWLAADGEWMGFFPGSLWPQSFTEIGTVQWFGEVSVASEPSCTDMGDGAFADSPGAATISSMQLIDQNGVARAAEPYAFATAPDWYTVDDARGGFGGPGACADTAITSAPLDVTKQRSPTFTFASEDPAARFECAFDPPAGPFAPCSGPGGSSRPNAPLSNGDHTFEVRAIDARGAVDPTPATAVFTVDTKPPRVRVEARRVQRLARGARLIVACDEPCSLTAAPTLAVRRGSRLTRIRLRTLRRELDGAGGETLVVRPAAALRSRLGTQLAHGARVVLTVKLVAGDRLGNISRRSVQMRLRR
jgi:hypothetical protein